MPAKSLNGIVIGYSDYRDNDRMLTLFTAEEGRVDCKARNCRKPTAPFLACAQPFVYGEYTIFFTQNRGTLNSCEIKENFYSLREDPDRFLTASALARLCQSVIEPDMPNEQLFSLLYYTLSFLAYSDTDPRDLLCGFLIHFLDRIGYRPALTFCAKCRRDVRADSILFFSPEAGGTVCAACVQGERRISKLALEAMRRMLLLSDEDLKKIRLTKELRTELKQILTESIEEALGKEDRGVKILYEMEW